MTIKIESAYDRLNKRKDINEKKWKCDNCVYGQKMRHGDKSYHIVCRRFPPARTQLDSEFYGHGKFVVRQPEVDVQDWCFEFQMKEEAK